MFSRYIYCHFITLYKNLKITFCFVPDISQMLMILSREAAKNLPQLLQLRCSGTQLPRLSPVSLFSFSNIHVCSRNW